MRGVLGRVSRTLLIAVIVAGAVLVGHLFAHEALSRAQLERAVADLAWQAQAAAGPLLRSRFLPLMLAFLSGAIVGWIGAVRWLVARVRRRPLLMADLRHADMPIADGIRHVRAHALPPVETDAAAMRLILREACRGRLSLWRQASADTLWRVPARRVRVAAKRLTTGGRGETWSIGDSLTGDPWRTLMLLGADMERLWPSGAGRRNAAAVPVTLSVPAVPAARN